VAAFRQNQWQLSSGIGGSFAVESVATFEQNTHLAILCGEVGKDSIGFREFFWGFALTTLRRR
jgi:hypothetical protein